MNKAARVESIKAEGMGEVFHSLVDVASCAGAARAILCFVVATEVA